MDVFLFYKEVIMKYVSFVRRETFKVSLSGYDKAPDPATLGNTDWWFAAYREPANRVAVCHGSRNGKILDDVEPWINQLREYLAEPGAILICCQPAAVKARYPDLPVLWPDHKGDVYLIRSNDDEFVVATDGTTNEIIRIDEGEEALDDIWDEMFQVRPRARDRRPVVNVPKFRGHRSGYKPPKKR